MPAGQRQSDVIAKQQQKRADAAKQAQQEVIEEIKPGILEWNGAGICATYLLAFVNAGEAEACLVYDGDRVAGIAFIGGGTGSPSISGSVGDVITNAESYKQILGRTVCAGVSFGEGVTVGGELCLSLDENDNPTGIWTFWDGVGIGLEGLPAVEGHLVYGTTEEIFELDVPCVDVDSPISVFGFTPGIHLGCSKE